MLIRSINIFSNVLHGGIQWEARQFRNAEGGFAQSRKSSIQIFRLLNKEKITEISFRLIAQNKEKAIQNNYFACHLNILSKGLPIRCFVSFLDQKYFLATSNELIVVLLGQSLVYLHEILSLLLLLLLTQLQFVPVNFITFIKALCPIVKFQISKCKIEINFIFIFVCFNLFIFPML